MTHQADLSAHSIELTHISPRNKPHDRLFISFIQKDNYVDEDEVIVVVDNENDLTQERAQLVQVSVKLRRFFNGLLPAHLSPNFAQKKEFAFQLSPNQQRWLMIGGTGALLGALLGTILVGQIATGVIVVTATLMICIAEAIHHRNQPEKALVDLTKSAALIGFIAGLGLGIVGGASVTVGLFLTCIVIAAIWKGIQVYQEHTPTHTDLRNLNCVGGTRSCKPQLTELVQPEVSHSFNFQKFSFLDRLFNTNINRNKDEGFTTSQEDNKIYRSRIVSI